MTILVFLIINFQQLTKVAMYFVVKNRRVKWGYQEKVMANLWITTRNPNLSFLTQLKS